MRSGDTGSIIPSMRRFAFHVLLLLCMLMQGAIVVGADFGHEDSQQHCAGHHAEQDCACCPDGAADSMSCTVQCSVSQAPIVLITLDRVVSHSTRVAFIQTTLANPAYAPLVPPPIL